MVTPTRTPRPRTETEEERKVRKRLEDQGLVVPADLFSDQAAPPTSTPTPTPTPRPAAETDSRTRRLDMLEAQGIIIPEELRRGGPPPPTPTPRPVRPTPTPRPRAVAPPSPVRVPISGTGRTLLPPIVPVPAEPRRGFLERAIPGPLRPALGPVARFGQGVAGSLQRFGEQQAPLIFRGPQTRIDELIRNAGFDPEEVRRNPDKRFEAPGYTETVGIPISTNRARGTVYGTGKHILEAAERVAREEPQPQQATAGRILGSVATLGLGEEPLRLEQMGGPLESLTYGIGPGFGPVVSAFTRPGMAALQRTIPRRMPGIPRLPGRGRPPPVPEGQVPPHGFAERFYPAEGAMPPTRPATARAADIPPTAAAQVGAKEPWQMTRDEWRDVVKYGSETVEDINLVETVSRNFIKNPGQTPAYLTEVIKEGLKTGKYSGGEYVGGPGGMVYKVLALRIGDNPIQVVPKLRYRVDPTTGKLVVSKKDISYDDIINMPLFHRTPQSDLSLADLMVQQPKLSIFAGNNYRGVFFSPDPGDVAYGKNVIEASIDPRAKIVNAADLPSFRAGVDQTDTALEQGIDVIYREAFDKVGEPIEIIVLNPKVLRRGTHEVSIRKALAEGKTVPDEVLRDYTDLAPTRPGAAATTAQVADIPVTPAAQVGGGAPRPGQAAADKLASLVEQAKPIREAAEAERSAELGRRVGRAARQLEQGPARAAFGRAQAPLAGELPGRAQFTAPEQLLSTQEVEGLFQTIRDLDKQFFQRLNTGVALEKVLTGQVPVRSEIALLEDVFGTRLAQAILKQRPGRERFLEGILDAANIPRSIVTSWDASAPLRQGVVLAAGHPKRFTQNVVTMFRALPNENFARAVDQSIRENPLFDLLVRRGPQNRRGLFIAERTGVAGSLASREEAFMSRLAQRIPGIRASERAYVTFLNKLRFDVATDTYNSWTRAGKTITERDIDELVLFLNRATGRGGLGALEGSAPILNAAFFSPRLLTSRFTLPQSLFATGGRGSESAGVLWLTDNIGIRKMVAKDLAAFVGTGIGILSILKLSGAADVELDPRSSDFGKIRIGKTRIDFWGGFQPIARMMAQFITNERKGLGTDTISGLNRLETVGRFVRSKLGPPGAFAVDVMGEKTFLGEELTLSQRTAVRQAYERFTPFFMQDMIDAVNEQGLTGGLLAASGGLGTGVTSFDTVEDAAQQKFGQSFTQIWPFEQREARSEFEGSRDEHFIGWLERERTPTRARDLDAQRLAQLEEVVADVRLTPRQKIDEYFEINAEFAVRRDENGQAIFGDEEFQGIAGGTPEQQVALQEYYDSLDTAQTPAGRFDSQLWNQLLTSLESKWRRGGVLDYIRANTNMRPVPQRILNLLGEYAPNYFRRIRQSDYARRRRQEHRDAIQRLPEADIPKPVPRTSTNPLLGFPTR